MSIGPAVGVAGGWGETSLSLSIITCQGPADATRHSVMEMGNSGCLQRAWQGSWR